jgi:hypothetical protein
MMAYTYILKSKSAIIFFVVIFALEAANEQQILIAALKDSIQSAEGIAQFAVRFPFLVAAAAAFVAVPLYELARAPSAFRALPSHAEEDQLYELIRAANAAGTPPAQSEENKNGESA